jgi:hypothetical protein
MVILAVRKTCHKIQSLSPQEELAASVWSFGRLVASGTQPAAGRLARTTVFISCLATEAAQVASLVKAAGSTTTTASNSSQRALSGWSTKMVRSSYVQPSSPKCVRPFLASRSDDGAHCKGKYPGTSLCGVSR